MLAGFTSAAANCTLFAWAFRANTYPMHSQPLDPAHLITTPPPHRRPHPHHYRYPWGAALSLLFAAACGAMLTFFILFVWYSLLARRPVAPVSPSDLVYEKIVLVGVKDDDAATLAAAPSPAVAAERFSPPGAYWIHNQEASAMLSGLAAFLLLCSAVE
ncbi:hypothetical protein E2562_004621 [Oryza meyeriana var. granulata]|uniref:Legume lectin domain-containing protein n=1 Tax=Oryza meyeriana var. granulata TaxID=110450 RepID=A0A6G1F3V4_9ORYZ|nr:hypothetical protein E2562_004621 [Oryza meyeriana var. granulata]